MFADLDTEQLVQQPQQQRGRGEVRADVRAGRREQQQRERACS